MVFYGMINDLFVNINYDSLENFCTYFFNDEFLIMLSKIGRGIWNKFAIGVLFKLYLLECSLILFWEVWLSDKFSMIQKPSTIIMTNRTIIFKKLFELLIENF